MNAIFKFLVRKYSQLLEQLNLKPAGEIIPVVHAPRNEDGSYTYTGTGDPKVRLDIPGLPPHVHTVFVKAKSHPADAFQYVDSERNACIIQDCHIESGTFGLNEPHPDTMQHWRVNSALKVDKFWFSPPIEPFEDHDGLP